MYILSNFLGNLFYNWNIRQIKCHFHHRILPNRLESHRHIMIRKIHSPIGILLNNLNRLHKHKFNKIKCIWNCIHYNCLMILRIILFRLSGSLHILANIVQLNNQCRSLICIYYKIQQCSCYNVDRKSVSISSSHQIDLHCYHRIPQNQQQLNLHIVRDTHCQPNNNCFGITSIYQMNIEGNSQGKGSRIQISMFLKKDLHFSNCGLHNCSNRNFYPEPVRIPISYCILNKLHLPVQYKIAFPIPNRKISFDRE